MADSDLFSDLLGSQSTGFMQKFRYGGSFKPRAKTEGGTTTTTFEQDTDPPASFQQPADLKEGEIYATGSAAPSTETPRFAGTAFNVDLRDYAPSFKVTRAAKGSRGGAIGGGQPMDTQEVSVAPLQKPAQFNFSQTIQEREQQPINIPNYSSQLDDLKKQLEALNAKKPEPAPTPPPPAPTPAPAPEPAPAPQRDNSARDAWNAVVAQQGKWNLWLS